MHRHARGFTDCVQTRHHGIVVVAEFAHHFAVVIGGDATHVVVHGGNDRDRLFVHVHASKNAGAFGDAGQTFVDHPGAKMG